MAQSLSELTECALINEMLFDSDPNNYTKYEGFFNNYPRKNNSNLIGRGINEDVMDKLVNCLESMLHYNEPRLLDLGIPPKLAKLMMINSFSDLEKYIEGCSIDDLLKLHTNQELITLYNRIGTLLHNCECNKTAFNADNYEFTIDLLEKLHKNIFQQNQSSPCDFNLNNFYNTMLHAPVNKLPGAPINALVDIKSRYKKEFITFALECGKEFMDEAIEHYIYSHNVEKPYIVSHWKIKDLLEFGFEVSDNKKTINKLISAANDDKSAVSETEAKILIEILLKRDKSLLIDRSIIRKVIGYNQCEILKLILSEMIKHDIEINLNYRGIGSPLIFAVRSGNQKEVLNILKTYIIVEAYKYEKGSNYNKTLHCEKGAEYIENLQKKWSIQLNDYPEMNF